MRARRGQLQIFVADADGRARAPDWATRGDVQRLTWSPNGQNAGRSLYSRLHREAGALAPGARDVGVIGAKVDEQRFATIDVVDAARCAC